MTSFKPVSATLPLPGVQAEILDNEGSEHRGGARRRLDACTPGERALSA